MKASWFLKEVSTWKCTSCVPFLLDSMEFACLLSVNPLHWC